MLFKLITLLARTIAHVAGDFLLEPPRWTAYVGQRWDTFDVKPWNLYNLLWGLGQWAFIRGEGHTHWRYFLDAEVDPRK